MSGIVLICASVLALADPPEAATETPRIAPTIQDLLGDGQAEKQAKYNAMREKTPKTAAAQWKLAVWCEENGLTAEAYAHFAEVLRLDPKRDAAWRKIGFKKHNGHWMNDAQIAEEAEQKKADKVWGPLLRKCHKDIHGGKKQAEAQATLEAIDDPRAVASIYREFAGGGERDQLIAVQALGQIRAPFASKVLALLGVYGKTTDVRRRAIETLRGRDSEEYLDVLVALLTDPLKYEVRPVGGPGSPGILFVEGQKFNVQRVYAPPPMPNLTPQPGDVVSYDAFGMPVIERPSGTTFAVTGHDAKTGEYRVQVNKTMTRFSATQDLLQAQQAAATAQLQLEGDVAAIEALNKARTGFNELVISVAKDASGKDLGVKPDDWRAALGKGKKYRETIAKASRKPTFDEVVPLAYLPNFGGSVSSFSFIKETKDL